MRHRDLLARLLIVQPLTSTLVEKTVSVIDFRCRFLLCASLHRSVSLSLFDQHQAAMSMMEQHRSINGETASPSFLSIISSELCMHYDDIKRDLSKRIITPCSHSSASCFSLVSIAFTWQLYPSLLDWSAKPSKISHKFAFLIQTSFVFLLKCEKFASPFKGVVIVV